MVDRPGLVVAGTILTVVGLSLVAGAPRTDNSLQVWFVRDDPALVRYRTFLAEFGNDEAVVIAYRSPAGADAAELELLHRTEERLRGIDGVARVVSPATFGSAPSAEAQRLMRRLGLAGETEGALALIAFMDARPDIDTDRGRILDEVRDALEETLGAAGRDVHLAGTGVLYEGLNDQTERDSAVFLTLSMLLMTVLLMVGLGRVTAVAAVLTAPLLATLAVTSLIALSGKTLNVVMATLPALILVIGVADGIHIFLEWYRVRRAAEPANVAERKALAGDVLARMALPCLFTSVTTAVAFAALLSSRMAVIRDLGIFAAIGVLIAWMFVLVACGAALSWVDVRPPARTPIARLRPPLARLGRNVTGRPARVIAAFAVALALLLLGAARIAVDTHTLELLPEGHEVRRDSDWIERNLALYTPLEFVITSTAGSVLQPETRAAISSWRRRAEQRPEVERTFSGLDVLELGGLGPAAPAAAVEAGLEAYRAATGDALGAYLSPARDRVRVTALVPMGTARDFATTVDALRAAAPETLGSRATVEAAGYLPLYVRIIDYTVSSAIIGLALAFAAVFLVLGALLRSWRLLLIAIPPNLFAVGAVFGFMGWVGIPLDIATATVGAIVLGIAVDDTVHLLHRYQELRRGGSQDAAADAVAETGPALVLTSAVLALGLGVLMAAGSLSVVYFGMVAAVAITAALLADLLLLPALLPRRRT